MKKIGAHGWFVLSLIGIVLFALVRDRLRTPAIVSTSFVGYATLLAVLVLVEFGSNQQFLGWAGQFFVWGSGRKKRVRKAPGIRLMLIATFLYSPADVEKVFEPTLADWRKEYFEALAARRRWKAQWINVRYRYRFALAMGLSKGWKLIDLVLQVVRSAISKS